MSLRRVQGLGIFCGLGSGVGVCGFRSVYAYCNRFGYHDNFCVLDDLFRGVWGF